MTKRIELPNNIDEQDGAEGTPVWDEEADGTHTVGLYNEGGYNGTSMRVEPLLEWIMKNEPRLIFAAIAGAAKVD